MMSQYESGNVKATPRVPKVGIRAHSGTCGNKVGIVRVLLLYYFVLFYYLIATLHFYIVWLENEF